MKIVGIKFEDSERIFYYYVNDIELKKNITVIVEDDHVLQFGKVVTDVHPIEDKKLKKELGKVVRIASKKDFSKHLSNLKAAKEALKKCRQLAKKYKLDMNIIDAVYTFNQDQLLFHFYADNRIDFRDLARDLAAIYKTRIELRQIGVRDKAKMVCGVGLCGQKLCCSRFLNEFDSVSISMAKNQNLSLNPTKINGVCGRLLCCLKYEDEGYKECRKGLPNVGQTVNVDGNEGKVISVDILKRTYRVETEKGIIEVDGNN